jgi:hypothetical protein
VNHSANSVQKTQGCFRGIGSLAEDLSWAIRLPAHPTRVRLFETLLPLGPTNGGELLPACARPYRKNGCPRAGAVPGLSTVFRQRRARLFHSDNFPGFLSPDNPGCLTITAGPHAKAHANKRGLPEGREGLTK